ncbi:MAG: hypothetical protein ACRDEA_02125 [Microcystaceae cyanobacterium]
MATEVRLHPQRQKPLKLLALLACFTLFKQPQIEVKVSQIYARVIGWLNSIGKTFHPHYMGIIFVPDSPERNSSHLQVAYPISISSQTATLSGGLAMNPEKSLDELRYFYDHYKEIYKQANCTGQMAIRTYLLRLKKRAKRLRQRNRH